MLAPCYLVHGGEPLQTDEYISSIKQLAAKEGYNSYVVFEVNALFNWEELLNKCQTMDLFAEKSLMELRLQGESFGKSGTKILENMLLQQPRDVCILIRAPKLSTPTLNSNWAKHIHRFGKVYAAKSIAANNWVNWIKQRLQQVGFNPTAEASEYLAQLYEGNLPAAAQCCAKLKATLPAGALELTQIKPFIDSNTHYSVFDLTDAMLSSDTKKTINIFQSLKTEGVDPILILWGITREIRHLLRLSEDLHKGMNITQSAQKIGIWRDKISNCKKTVDRLSINRLQHLLRASKAIDAMLKGITPGNAWEPLLAVCLTLACGKNLTMEELNI